MSPEFPNRTTVLALLGAEYDPEAVALVRAAALPDDLSRRGWIELLRRVERTVRADRRRRARRAAP